MPATNTASTPSASLVARYIALHAMPGYTGGTQRQIRAAYREHSLILEAAADEKVPMDAVCAASGLR